ncbi:S-adenosyl-L-methionine-dependent methyltransferase [Trematosphaeria pertusa]|uniref:S-adenosyl-L-methionine-dependent methyltransferase n=1 Tax=Trematosphaeria pertusa TaxID=390896 RepID=A0A6A6J2E9_9PLEO|nr:S-adenosyl-L-methionine-dependent methyltransferase [Trematosphaeria pertusa]KAF2256816.1 S-adenosyl-L-methionine-dependent methyltransferase [Trematosphaeria pertusa]
MPNPDPAGDFARFPTGYILDRSHLAACRLNLQHFLWGETFRFTIHPSITLPAKPAIADVACGTGLWLIDAAAQHPEARLHGFDIDLSQAPHPSWLPPNVKLSEWNIFDDIPDEWIGKFDLVHVRLLLLVFSGIDPKPFIEKLYRLLRPGGYLQWDELDCVNMHVRKIDRNIAAPALEGLRTMCYAEGRHDWVLQLRDMLSSAGFEAAALEKYGDNPTLARAYNDLHLHTMEEIATRLLQMRKEDEAAHVFGLIREGYGEAVNGAALCLPRIVCVARKPS